MESIHRCSFNHVTAHYASQFSPIGLIAMRSPLTLGTEGLSSPENALVKALLKIMATDDDFSWRFALAGPFDAVLIDASITSPTSEATCVIKLAALGSLAVTGEFARPINAPVLEQWLKTIERQLKPTRSTGLMQTIQIRDESVTPTKAVLPTSVAPDGGDRYKLLRWPPVIVLRNDQRRVRLATLIARQFMDLSQLKQTSGFALDECESFILVLRALGLVHIEPAFVQAPVTSETRPTAVSPPKRSRQASLSFIAAIRQKLGL